MSVAVEQLLVDVQKQAEKEKLLYIGKSYRRLDDVDKILGRPIYTADSLPASTLYGKLVHSRVPHGLIRSISTSQALRSPRVIDVLTHRDVPGLNESSLILHDRQLFADKKVRSTGDIVAAVIAKDTRSAEEAVNAVRVEYQELKAVFDPLAALESDAPLVHERTNLVKQVKIRKGDIERGFQDSDVIVENTFNTQFQDATPMEPEVGLAVPRSDGDGILIIGSMQSPHFMQMSLSKILNLPREKVEVVQAVTGGAFGPKSDETPVDVAAIAAIGALKARKPVLVNLTRSDSMIIHTKRHRAVIKHKTGAKSSGKLVASQVQIFFEGGAYASQGVPATIRAMIHANGPYEIPNVKNDAYKIYTNNTFAGSFRGFGAPQAIFAAESQTDEVARRLEMDPLDFRLMNMIGPGRQTATGQVIDESCGLGECLERAINASNYREKKTEFRRDSGKRRRGIGMAMIHHGNSLTSEGKDYAYVHLSVDLDGTIHLGTGLTEYGTGSISGLAQVAASVLGCPFESFVIDRPNTLKHKESGPTVASRVTVIGANAAKDAAEKLRGILCEVAAKMLAGNSEPTDIAIVNGAVFSRRDGKRIVSWEDLVAYTYRERVTLTTVGEFRAPDCSIDEETGLGSPYTQYTYGVAVAEVEVDIETGLYNTKRFTVAFDIGKAINPRNVISQIYGGSIQGLGYATMEELIHKDGVVLNPNLKDYYIPTSLDIPEEFIPILVEIPGPLNHLGSKSIGEPPIVLPAPTIRNAVLDAIGKSINSIPVTSEKIFDALSQ